METVELKNPFSLKFEPVKSIDNVIFELPLDTMTSIRGEVTNIEVKKKPNSTIHFYTVTDNSGSIVLFSNKKLDLKAKLSYIIKNVKVTHYSQVRQVEWSLTDDIQKITVNALKLINEQKCCIYKHLLSAEIIDADKVILVHLVKTCREKQF